MDDVLHELESAFNIISAIPVTGDSVDNMAAARSKLRRVYAKLSSMNNKSSEKTDTPDNSAEV